MAEKTKNYGLTKPTLEEFYDVNVQNANMDKIDEELKKKYDANNKPSPSDLGASPTGHKHTKSEITDFPTSMTPTSHTHDVEDVTGTLPLSKGGTGATDAANARNNLGITPANIGASPTAHKHTKSEITDFPTSMTPTAHNHSASDINSGTFSSDRLPTVPVAKGGTGATSASSARTNLGIKSETWTFTLEDGSTVTKAVYVG